ncbi:MAG: glucose-methanol-choline oxidoreductase [Betaproteobacteria bacterium RIFCSPLOWO2_02_67_12]|nr:MAG: glucose-methanol-choline oxidoreductase [Betaproteobacteria bacterium RIFCSPLOWO2_02_67_12]OGA28036.1 MAG: glucose-methanol-choline oxidoreductase [Betaproteobacteria bacterium RIFCSPLOWO2_02_FULL_68_150]
MNEFDYVVVGGGSAGCALAARLSEDPAMQVCLLEAGGRGRSFLIDTPILLALTVPHAICNWAFATVPQAGLDGRKGYQPRGKALGGSSAINAMVYMRGHPRDYDDWAAAGNRGWGWRDLLPLFKRNEHNERGADEYHGGGGPLNVADVRSPNPASHAFVEAGVQAGHARNRDFNGASQDGVGLYQVTQKNGRRWSAARAYLDPAANRSNLTVITSAHALRLTLEGKTCTGVETTRGHLRARRETIVCAGAFGSPQLLLLSGIGAQEELAPHGIALHHELPGVGCNLQDHPDYVIGYLSDAPGLLGLTPRGLLNLARGWPAFWRDGSGILASNIAEAGGFLRSRGGLERPDLQLHFTIGLVADHGRDRKPRYGFSCHVCVLRPKSRGRVSLTSSNPLAAPRIDPAFLEHDDDARDLLRGVKMTREILEQPALGPYRGANVFGEPGKSDEQLLALVRRRADTVYHPVGTCRMGSDEMAVVDAELRVRGLDRLRVADASIMPTLIGGNTNAPAMVIGEKAAERIRTAR